MRANIDVNIDQLVGLIPHDTYWGKHQGKESWPATAWAGRIVTREKETCVPLGKKFVAALRAAPQKTEERKCKGINR